MPFPNDRTTIPQSTDHVMRSRERLLDPRDRLLDVRARVERGEAEVALAGRAEARTRSTDDLRLVQQRVEELPGRGAIARAQPDIRSVDAAEHREAGAAEP